MWYTLEATGCRNCGRENDPLAWQCPGCGLNPFTGAALVAGPIPWARFAGIVGFRLMIGGVLFGYLWYKETHGDHDWYRSFLFYAPLAIYVGLMLIMIDQLRTLLSLRLVIEEGGLTVFRRSGSRTQWLLVGWDELAIPELCRRFYWIRFAGCLLSYIHLLHLILPQIMEEIWLRSDLASEKCIRVPIAPSVVNETRLLSMLSVHALPFWIMRRLVAVYHKQPPSAERRLVLVDFNERQVRGDQLPEEIEPVADGLQPPQVWWSDWDSETEADNEQALPYQDGYYLMAYWNQPAVSEDEDDGKDRVEGSEKAASRD